jgi:hypothetical protein
VSAHVHPIAPGRRYRGSTPAPCGSNGAAPAVAFSTQQTAAPIPPQPRPTDRVLAFSDVHSQVRDGLETVDQVRLSTMS